jgi:predicted nuclease with RNAse H fold
MIAGIVLTEKKGEKCQVAMLDEKLEVIELETNEEIVELVKERKPQVLAINAGQLEGSGLKKEEENLKEEGHAFMPSSHEKQKSRRMEALENQLELELGPEKPAVIRFDPHITAKELALDGDDALEGLGIETGNIDSAKQFDAALGAVTARFYQQNQYEDLGVIVPETMREAEDTEGF